MAFPSYMRLLSRLCREAAEQAEAEVRDETAGSAGTEAAPRPTPALSYLPQAVGEAEAPRTSVSYILWIQQALNRADNAKLIEDGKTGPATRAAVAHFQRLHGLHVDGTVGPDTEKALAAASNMQPPTSGAVQSSPATSHAVYANWSDADDRRKGAIPVTRSLEARRPQRVWSRIYLGRATRPASRRSATPYSEISRSKAKPGP